MAKIKDCKYRKIIGDKILCFSFDRRKVIGKDIIDCPFDADQDSTACIDFKEKEFDYVDEIESAIYGYLLSHDVLDKVRKWVSIFDLAIYINEYLEKLMNKGNTMAQETNKPHITIIKNEKEFHHLMNIKDLIWFLRGYIARGEDELNDFCNDHIETLKLAMKLIRKYYQEEKNEPQEEDC